MGRADTCSSQSSLRRSRRIRRMARSRERAPLGSRRQGGGPYWLMPVISPHDDCPDCRRAPMPQAKKARAVGFNHVALEVGDIEEALAFYGRLFDFKLRGRSATMAFIDLGDQFIALQKGRRQGADDGRHFGLVVDDKQAVREAMAAAGVEPIPGQ